MLERVDRSARLVSAVLSPSQMMKRVFSELGGRYDVTLIKTVKELDLGTAPVVSIPANKTLVEALYTMQVWSKAYTEVVLVLLFLQNESKSHITSSKSWFLP